MHAELVDKKMSIGIIDTQFIAARNDSKQRGYKLHNQSQNEINRFEFWELLIRVAGFKFKDEESGSKRSFAVCFKTLLEFLSEHYLPYPI